MSEAERVERERMCRSEAECYDALEDRISKLEKSVCALGDMVADVVLSQSPPRGGLE